MTEIAPAAAPQPVACPHCGDHGSGTFCSGCGKPLQEQSVLREAWDQVVVERLRDLRDYVTTTIGLFAHPVRFFRTVLAAPARRAGHVFPAPVAEPLPRGSIQSPVAFFVLSFVASIIAAKIGGTSAEMQVLKGVDDDLNNEVMLAFMLVFIGLYALAFRWSTGKRISTEEAAVFSGYVGGANATLTGIFALLPGSTYLTSALGIYLAVVVPQAVLPRLYGLSRKRVVVAQVGGVLGALVMMVLGLAIIDAIVGLVKPMIG